MTPVLLKPPALGMELVMQSQWVAYFMTSNGFVESLTNCHVFIFPLPFFPRIGFSKPSSRRCGDMGSSEVGITLGRFGSHGCGGTSSSTLLGSCRQLIEQHQGPTWDGQLAPHISEEPPQPIEVAHPN